MKKYTEAGFAVLEVLLIGLVVLVVAGAGWYIAAHHKSNAALNNADKTQTTAGKAQKIGDTNKTNPTDAAQAPTSQNSAPQTQTNPSTRSTSSTSSQPNTSTPTPQPTPAPATPTTITIGTHSYKCDESDNVHWKGLVYAHLSPTSSYSSPNGAKLHDYNHWANITGLSCASTQGWLQRGDEYFNGQDLIVS
jgi:hypothetical protein